VSAIVAISLSHAVHFQFLIVFCVDEDECFSSPCSHICENLVGSFKCRCADGYQLLADNVSCVAADGLFHLT